jgi:hypothetical protein
MKVLCKSDSSSRESSLLHWQAPNLSQQQKGIGGGPSLGTFTVSEAQNTDSGKSYLLAARRDAHKVVSVRSSNHISHYHRVGLLNESSAVTEASGNADQNAA